MRIFFALALTFFVFSCQSGVQKDELTSPDITYGKLFEEVQMSRVFEDGKTFVDCVPVFGADYIMEAYEEQKTSDTFNLKNFVNAHFELPISYTSDFKSDTSASVEAHINSLWPILTRKGGEEGGTLIKLRKSYVVPGGRFREVYYWDSYFTMLGLQAAGKTESIENMVLNFAQLIQDIGHIPNGNRTYYMSRSQPPFFALMVNLLAETKNDKRVIVQFLPQLQREYQYWMAVETEESRIAQNNAKKASALAYRKAVFIGKDNILNRYYDESETPRPESYREDVLTAKASGRPLKEMYRHLRSGAESGWDYSSRWLKDGKTLETIHTTDIAPVDLNALLYYAETLLAEAYDLSEKPEFGDSFRTLAAKRKALFDTYFWNEKTGFYHDYDFVAKQKTDVLSLAGVYPLFVNIASQQQADAVAKVIQEKFLQPGGLPATLANIGQQWDAPNGWAPLQWMAIKGLRNYGHTELADEIKTRWIANNKRVYKNTGKMVEKYNVYDLSLLAGGGEYPVQDGFGWSNGVLLKLMTE
ncbi:MAG: alpha,alpha-trehalase TreF [Spirosomaceae bacterium]|nr:alpha,alpha-trehalase TreF [Spirosomataceae bacterium]